MILFTPTKFHRNRTKGFEEIELKYFSMQIFKSPITPPKIIYRNRITICTTKHGTDQSYKVSLNSDNGVWRNCADKMLNANISKSHNSTINHWTGTGLQYAQLGMVLINRTNAAHKKVSRKNWGRHNNHHMKGTWQWLFQFYWWRRPQNE